MAVKKYGTPLVRWIGSFLLFLLLFMTLYRFLFFFYYQPPNRPFTGSAFLLGLRYDARVLSVLGLAMLILSAIRPLNPFKNKSSRLFWKILLSIIVLLLLIFYGTDFYYFDYLHARLNASVVNFLQDAAISFNMMWETYPLIKILLLFFIFIAGFIWMLNGWFHKIDRRQTVDLGKRSRWVLYTSMVLLFAVLIFGRLGQYPLRWSDAYSLGDDFKAATALNPVQSFFSTLQFKNSGYQLSAVKKDFPLMAQYYGLPLADSATLNFSRTVHFADTLVDKPNVVLVICESFSAYKSSMFGNGLNPTPFFNSLCNHGVFFERCFVPAFGTAKGVWAVITGVPDVEQTKTASRNPAMVDQHTIINDFKGYDKNYFIGGSTSWANIRGLLTNNINGLRIYEQDDFNSSKVDVWGVSDKNLFLETNKILATKKTPFFSIIQTADNHRPYTIPHEDLEEFKKVNYPDDTLKKYGFDDNGQLNAFRYSDFCFQKFMEAAAKEKYFKNTIFIFVGDHGLRGNDAGEMFPKAFSKQGILAQHVPLLFYAPALLKPRRIKEVCSQLDILPSVAALAKISHTNTAMGINLFDTSRKVPRLAFIADPNKSNESVVSDRYYFTHDFKTGAEDFVSVIDNSIPQNDSAKNYMRNMSRAFYETAQYLLLNNKKKP